MRPAPDVSFMSMGSVMATPLRCTAAVTVPDELMLNVVLLISPLTSSISTKGLSRPGTLEGPHSSSDKPESITSTPSRSIVPDRSIPPRVPVCTRAIV